LVGLSAAATHERVRRLTSERVILGYEAVIDVAKVTGGMLIYTGVSLDRTSPQAREAFKAAVKARPEVLNCYELVGGVDFLFKTRVPNLEAYRDLITSVMWLLPGVREVRTYPVLDEIKSTERMPF
jgi:Lrp/AsnC family leucine-responsive transcriptional regulator